MSVPSTSRTYDVVEPSALSKEASNLLVPFNLQWLNALLNNENLFDRFYRTHCFRSKKILKTTSSAYTELAQFTLIPQKSVSTDSASVASVKALVEDDQFEQAIEQARSIVCSSQRADALLIWAQALFQKNQVFLVSRLHDSFSEAFEEEVYCQLKIAAAQNNLFELALPFLYCNANQINTDRGVSGVVIAAAQYQRYDLVDFLLHTIKNSQLSQKTHLQVALQLARHKKNDHAQQCLSQIQNPQEQALINQEIVLPRKGSPQKQTLYQKLQQIFKAHQILSTVEV